MMTQIKNISAIGFYQSLSAVQIIDRSGGDDAGGI